jgi:L-lactate dehydrogenase (cytochrome)
VVSPCPSSPISRICGTAPLGRGAHGCLTGPAHLYGLAANGEAGVRQALDIIRAELEVAITLTGLRDIREVSRAVIV